MARLTSVPVNENNNSSTHLNARLNFTHIESNPLLKSLYDQVDAMLQQSSGQDITKLFYVVFSAIDKNFSNPTSPLSMNSDANNLRQLFNTQNDRISLTLTLRRLTQQSTPQSVSSEESLTSNLPPPPETWSDTDMTSLIDQVIKDEELIGNFSSAYGWGMK